jgi:hypothetical protein
VRISNPTQIEVLGNRVLRRIFGPKRDEVTEGWRKLHNEEIHNLYSSPNKGMWNARGKCEIHTNF